MSCAAALLGLAACTPSYSPNTYASSAVQQANKVDQGVVVGVRPVGVSAAGTVGAATGAAAGGIAGAQVPGGGASQAFGAVGGALVGGLVGTGIEHVAGDTAAFEYIVRKDNGDLLSVTQKDTVPIPIGTKVLLIAGSQARIIRDYTVAPKSDDPPKSEPALTAPAPPPVFDTPLPDLTTPSGAPVTPPSGATP